MTTGKHEGEDRVEQSSGSDDCVFWVQGKVSLPYQIEAQAMGGEDESVTLSLVLPTFREARNVTELVERVDGLLQEIMPNDYELIVVDDNSPDGTWEMARDLCPTYPALRVIRRDEESGLSSAVIRGWQAARGRILGVIDADLQHPPETLCALLKAMKGADLAVASRHVEGGGVSDWAIQRRVLSRSAQLIGILILPEVLRRVSDPMSGYFLVKRSCLSEVIFKPKGYKILLEVLGRGDVGRVAEVGYVFQEREKGESKVGLKQYVDYLLQLLHLRVSRFQKTMPWSATLLAKSGGVIHRGSMALAWMGRMLVDVGKGIKRGMGVRNTMRAGGVLAIALLLFLGLLRLPTPFAGDQALFLTGAKAVAEGAVPYQEFWDNKQPGIYLFYGLAGSLFGYSEVGVHLFEFLWYLAISGLFVYVLRDWIRQPSLLVLGVGLTGVAYYCLASASVMAQVESLVALPLLGCLLLANRTVDLPLKRQLGYWAGSAACASLVAMLKLVLIPIPVAFWLCVLLPQIREEGLGAWRRVPVITGACLLGGAPLLLLVTAWMAATGALSDFLWTMFQYPREALSAAPPAPPARLMKGLLWILCPFVFFLPVLGFVLARWRGWRGELVFVQMAAWLVVGGGMLLLQRFSWWTYHFAMFLVPLAALVLRGLDGLRLVMRDRMGVDRAREVMVGGIAVCCLPVLALMIYFPLGSVSTGLGGGPFGSKAYTRALSEDYEWIHQETEFLRSAKSRDPIYVMGNPLFYVLSGRSQALPVHGWSWEFFLTSQWEELPESIERIRPKWIFVSDFYADLINERNPRVNKVLQAEFVEQMDIGKGRWFALREVAP